MTQKHVLLLLLFISFGLLNAQVMDILTGPNGVSSIAFYGDDLFYSEMNSDKISKINVSDPQATPITVVESGIRTPSSLLFVDNILFIAEIDQ